MVDIPTNDGLARLEMLKDYGYSSAEEVFYLAQALGPELADMVGIAPVDLMTMLAPMLNLLSEATSTELQAQDYSFGVPINLAPPEPPPISTAPVPAAPPAEINHITAMPPVRNQGPRGTCVAHATVAVMEHRLNTLGAPNELSEQFLYWDCKQNDQIPTESGTWLRIAFPLLARDGVCREGTWRYEPTPCATEACGPPPPGAISEALMFRQAVLPLAPTSVLDIKAQLARGSCVAFSVPVFRSWFQSTLVRATGKINMPLPNDILEGGHAMCLVGYADSAEQGTGGGRFLLRNSWGAVWAPQSPYGAGYGTIPYAYIQRYCSEAFSLK